MEQLELRHDIIDTQYSLKKFFKLIYRDIDFKEEYIRVFQNNNTYKKESTYSKVLFFNDIDELIKFSTNKYIRQNNTYFNLATTDGEGGSEEYLRYRYCLGFDFDKKDNPGLTAKDILNKFKKLKIHYHALIDSGNGYHVYVCINRTSNLKMVNEVQKELIKRLGADKKADLKTQILRVPYTFNIKDYPKRVKIITMDDRNSHEFRPYNIEFLYKKNCIQVGTHEEGIQSKYIFNNTNIPNCIKNIIENGSEEGNRYKDLQNIVVALRQRNKTLGEIKEVCKEWSLKSNYNDNLNYRIENIYNNKQGLELNCKECLEFDSCYNKIISNFEFKEDEKIITLSETNMNKLKKSNRKGAKIMKSNDLLVYCILKNHYDGLTREELVNELTYTKKKVVKNVALGERTLKDTLKSLEENGFIEVIKGVKKLGIKDIYKLKEDRAKVELKYNISFGATYECIKGNISTEELRLYNYMRYLHHKRQREDVKALKGNLFQVNQIDLAKELGVTQGRISVMISNLIDEKLLSIWYRQSSKNNGFDFNIYRLNY